VKTIRCIKCGVFVTHSEESVNGCNCDPDAPSWIAFDRSGRILKMSGANYEEVE
jgi:hypothetical protein